MVVWVFLVRALNKCGQVREQGRTHWTGLDSGLLGFRFGAANGANTRSPVVVWAGLVQRVQGRMQDSINQEDKYSVFFAMGEHRKGRTRITTEMANGKQRFMAESRE